MVHLDNVGRGLGGGCRLDMPRQGKANQPDDLCEEHSVTAKPEAQRMQDVHGLARYVWRCPISLQQRPPSDNLHTERSETTAKVLGICISDSKYTSIAKEDDDKGHNNAF